MSSKDRLRKHTKASTVQDRLQPKSHISANPSHQNHALATLSISNTNHHRLSPQAVLQLQRTLSNRAVSRLLAPQSKSNLFIQRKAGIEYETAIAARDPDTYDNNPNSGLGHVAQDKEMLDSGQGWKIYSDNSKLEFVTEPAVEIGELGDVVDSMLDALTGLQVPAQQQSIDGLFPGQPTKNYTLLPYDKLELTGSPQGTVGIPFNKLFKFFEFLTKYELESSKAVVEGHQAVLKQKWLAAKAMEDGPAKQQQVDKLNGASKELKQERDNGSTAISEAAIKRFKSISAHVSEITTPLQNQVEPDDLSKLQGMLHFVGQYALQSMSHTHNYKKIAFPVMSRSSFTSMYAALGGAKDHFHQAANVLMTKLGIDLATAKAFPEHETGFKIEDWLKSIEQPVDIPIPTDRVDQYGQEEFDTVQSDLMTAPGAAQHANGAGYKTDKSMGSMGLDNGLVVVELRNLKHFAQLGTHNLAAMRKMAADLSAIVTG